MNAVILSVSIIIFHLSLSYTESSFSTLPIKNVQNIKKALCEMFPKSLKVECYTEPDKSDDKEFYIPHQHQFICKRIAMFLGHDLDTSKSPEQLKKLFLPTCNMFRSHLRNICKKFTEEEGKKIIKKLLKKENPKKVCKKRLLRVSVGKNNGLITAKSKVNNPLECLLCKEIIKYLDEILKKESTKEEILLALNKVCSLLPANKSKQCVLFIDKYASKIMDFLVDGNPPEMVCHFLLVCSSKDTVPEDTMYFIPKSTYGNQH